MKKIMFLLAAIVALASCQRTADVPYMELDNYFFRNDAVIPENPRIDTQESFESLFGMAAVMGKGGQPTPVDFSSEIVIAVVNPVTDVYTELKPVSLVRDGKELVFTYEEKTGDKQGWSMQPVLLVKVNRNDDPGKVRLKKDVID